jgi:hypothetical protein
VSERGTELQPVCPSGRAESAQWPVVAILLGTFNGARYIDEQLESLARQTYPSWRLVVSDDGSQDDTVARVQAFADRFAPGRVHVRSGPRQGFVQNFLHLACDSSIDAAYFAFCDQDDVWDPDRLACSIQALQGLPPNRPLLYGARTRGVDAQGRFLCWSPLFRRPPSFRNALVQSLAGGNTMTFNRAARDLLCHAGPVTVPVHDWWVYVVVTACGGAVVYDPQAHIAYRQHGANQIGLSSSWVDLVRRQTAVVRGRLKTWNHEFEEALQRLDAQMSPDSRHVFEQFVRARRSGRLGAFMGVIRSGVYRQSRIAQVALWGAALGGYL